MLHQSTQLLQVHHLCSTQSRLQVKELGVRSVILDGPDSWSQTLFTEGVIDKFIGIDFAEADAVFERCCAAMQSVQKVPLRPTTAHWNASESKPLCGRSLTAAALSTALQLLPIVATAKLMHGDLTNPLNLRLHLTKTRPGR